MTHEIATIDRLAVRWHTVDEGWETPTGPDRARLDRLCAELVDGRLADALEGAGVSGEDEICVQRVAVPTHRIRWDTSDETILETWGRTIAEAVATASRGGTSDGLVVRYRSRGEAVADVVAGATAGDLGRAWAWNLLGLWPPDGGGRSADTSAWIVDLLVEHPMAISPGLLALARAGRLRAFLRHLDASEIVRLAAIAWVQGGGREADLRARSAEEHPGTPAQRAAAAIVLRSVVVASMGSGLGPLVDHDGPAQAGRLSPTPTPAVEPGGVTAASWVPDLAVLLGALAILEVEPSIVGSGPGADILRLVAQVIGHPEAATSAPGHPTRSDPSAGSSSARSRLLPDDLDPESRDVAESHGETATERARPPSRTEWGGLLFLLGIVADVELPTRLPDDPALATFGLRCALHRIGHQIIERAAPGASPPEADDPAILAFAGLAPDTEPPPPLTTPSSGATDALTRETDGLVAALRIRLGDDELATADEVVLLQGVCRRTATIEADPGWIDVLLDLDQVSTSVRVAGLDLDPGHVPWLGCVVRFRYG